jgi:hypothetical protein
MEFDELRDVILVTEPEAAAVLYRKIPERGRGSRIFKGKFDFV